MEIIEDIAAMKAYVRTIKASGETIAFVPTMGYLHQGHLDLMRMGRELADHLVISIFVNPTQFAPGEDLDNYPRDLERDKELAESVGVEAIFFPSSQMMYPEGAATFVNVEGITTVLCGRSRPTHFRGVTTVVAKLFNIVEPDLAIFGEKDYQQLAVIRRMARDLDMNVRILSHPIVREADGLAMSSRNKYLSDEQRRNALDLSRSLAVARDLYAQGERSVAVIKAAIVSILAKTAGAEIDYVEILDAINLNSVNTLDQAGVVALAVKFGATRLIDNTVLGEIDV